jgi:ATP-dependent DNA helicase RecQ
VSPLIALDERSGRRAHCDGSLRHVFEFNAREKESRERLRRLYNGEYRLLYVAPERLMIPSFLERLREWNVALIAIDEAHCISEWGHDFRPEYRQLSRLRSELPGVPFMALTATATERVRGDILAQLQLREPARLRWQLQPRESHVPRRAKDGPTKQVIAFLRNRRNESGIIYCQSRKSCEALAERLSEAGFAARPYHAGLPDEERSGNQDLFLRDEVRIICATIAFGMGINKPNVRYVLHHDLPKNIEGYYQETGRAGRDGLPSECVLLFSASDIVKQSGFLEEISDQAQRQLARAQLQQIIHYAESCGCRRRELLGYFGETMQALTCNNCDNCLEPRETWDGTLAAQKLLSTVWRAREASYRKDATFGLGHHADVLTGTDQERVQKWQHHLLTTFGIGKEHTKSEWQFIGRELLRLGLLRLGGSEFPTVDLTPEGVRVLKTRERVLLTRLPERSKKRDEPSRSRNKAAGEITCDEALFDALRDLRREIADGLGVPAYIVFGDVTLRQMAREYPTDERQLRNISGVGEQKLERFGADFLDAIVKYLRQNNRREFVD